MLELLVGLNVTDQELYKRYREEMLPILTEMGGGFRYDFTIEETLRSETEKPINRVFTIYFPDAATKDAFFANEAYKAVGDKYYKASVGGTTIMAEYER